jgi:hypothetical protein
MHGAGKVIGSKAPILAGPENVVLGPRHEFKVVETLDTDTRKKFNFESHFRAEDNRHAEKK